jgi:hypothetical protein
MFQLIYISTARPGVDQHEVSRILAKARGRNLADRITGLLVFDGVRFLQALEGDHELVEACYARIRKDERHRAPVTLSERDIEKREFGDWTMAWTRVDKIEGNLPLGEMVDSLVRQVTDPNTRALFRSFARIDRRAA